MLCRFLKALGCVLQSPESFPFPPSGSLQDMVGVSGPGPEQDRRRECAGSLRRNGCNVRTLAPGGGTGFSLFHPLGSPPWRGREALKRPETSFRRRAEAPGSLKRPSHFQSTLLQRTRVGKAPSPPPPRVGGAQNLETWMPSDGFPA